MSPTDPFFPQPWLHFLCSSPWTGLLPFPTQPAGQDRSTGVFLDSCLQDIPHLVIWFTSHTSLKSIISLSLSLFLRLSIYTSRSLRIIVLSASLQGSQVAQQVKNTPAIQETQETWVRSLGWEDPLEEGMATHSRILAWRIPWTEEPTGLQSMGSQRVEQDWACTHISLHLSHGFPLLPRSNPTYWPCGVSSLLAPCISAGYIFFMSPNASCFLCLECSFPIASPALLVTSNTHPSSGGFNVTSSGTHP